LKTEIEVILDFNKKNSKSNRQFRAKCKIEIQVIFDLYEDYVIPNWGFSFNKAQNFIPMYPALFF